MKSNFIISNITIYDESINSFFLTSKSLKSNFEKKSYSVPNELILNSKDMEQQTQFILNKYNFYKEVLANKLNQIHNISLDQDFWDKSFNLYIIRVIMSLWIRFNKFNNFDITKHQVKVLNSDLYRYVNSSPDSLFSLMIDDFYQEQIFSIYIKTFYPDYTFDTVDYHDETVIDNSNSTVYDFSKLKLEKVNILDTYIDPLICKDINKGIKNFYLPDFYIENHFKNKSIRDALVFEESLFYDEFDKFFFNSIKYLLPQTYLENFHNIYTEYNKVDFSKAKYILCENWMSNDKLSLFLAIAKNKGILHYSLEHGHTNYIKNNYAVFLYRMVDNYISYGWKNNKISNLISTGMWRIESSYIKDKKNVDVLFVGYGNSHLYDTDFINGHYLNNAAQENYFHNMKIVFDGLSISSKEQITYKQYPSYRNQLFDIDYEYTKRFKSLKSLAHNKELGYGNIEFISKCKLVIIGNIGTAFFEDLYYGVPLITWYSKEFSYIEEEYLDIFEQLESVGILQKSPSSMASFINKIIIDPYVWWYSDEVQQVRNNFLNLYSSPSKKFKVFLNNLYEDRM